MVEEEPAVEEELALEEEPVEEEAPVEDDGEPEAEYVDLDAVAVEPEGKAGEIEPLNTEDGMDIENDEPVACRLCELVRDAVDIVPAAPPTVDVEPGFE